MADTKPDAPADPKPDAAGGKAKDQKPKSALRTLREWVITFAVVLAILAPIRSSIADWNDVPSGSMRPTILEGERIFVNKLAYGLRLPFTHRWLARWGGPSSGDIVTFASPTDGTRLVKRVVAVAGDKVSLNNNVLSVNGKVVTEEPIGPGDPTRLENGQLVPNSLFRENLPGKSHVVTLSIGVQAVRTFPETVVPEGSVWVMGDNRDLSRDSRFFGPVKLEKVYGRSSVIVFSMDPFNSYWPRFSRWFKSIG